MSRPDSRVNLRRGIVFDADLWGGKDHPGGNERYWKPATILETRRNGYGEDIATVRFDHDGRVSRGHFTNCMRGLA